VARTPAHPDQVLLHYLELTERLRSPISPDPIVERGLQFAAICRGCGSDERADKVVPLTVEAEQCETTLVALSRAGRLQIESRCARCRGPWTVVPAVLLRSDFSSRARVSGPNVSAVGVSNPSGVERLHAEAATYGTALSRLKFWQRRIYLLLYLWEETGSYAAVADEATRRWRRTRRVWSEWHVRTTVFESQNVIWTGLHGRPWRARIRQRAGGTL